MLVMLMGCWGSLFESILCVFLLLSTSSVRSCPYSSPPVELEHCCRIGLSFLPKVLLFDVLEIVLYSVLLVVLGFNSTPAPGRSMALVYALRFNSYPTKLWECCWISRSVGHAHILWGVRRLFGLAVARCSESLVLRHFLVVFSWDGMLLLFSIDEGAVARSAEISTFITGICINTFFHFMCLLSVGRDVCYLY